MAFPTRALLFVISFMPGALLAQGTTDHVNDKMYVIRISAISSEPGPLGSNIIPSVRKALQEAYGLLDHVEPYLHTVMDKDEPKWFLAYFDPQRQSKEALLQDHYLFDWALHGQDVQICPLEQIASPAMMSDLQNPSGRKQ